MKTIRRSLASFALLGCAAWLGPPNALAQAPESIDRKLDALNAALDSQLMTPAEYAAEIDLLVRAAAPAAAPRGDFQTFDEPSGGRVIAGSLGPQPDPGVALGAALRRIHAEFGARPTISDIAQNPATYTLALFFAARRDGRAYTGLAIVDARPGAPASVAIVYDSSERFAASLGSLLRRLKELTSAEAAPAGEATAPPAIMTRHDFSDGTGSIEVPADWRLITQGGGSANAVGPTGEVVAYNMALSGMDPNTPMARSYLQSLQNLSPQLRDSMLRQTALIPHIADPAVAWVTLVQEISRKLTGRAPVINVKQSTPLDPQSAGFARAFLVAEGTNGPNDTPGVFIANVQTTPANAMGQWSVFASFVFVPNSEIPRYGATTMAVLASVRINFGAVNAQAQATREMFRQKFESMIQSAREQDEARRQRTDQFLAADREAQESMHRQAVAFENYALDRAVVVDLQTGDHATLDAALAQTLVHEQRGFQMVPPSELIPGVDY